MNRSTPYITIEEKNILDRNPVLINSQNICCSFKMCICGKWITGLFRGTQYDLSRSWKSTAL